MTANSNCKRLLIFDCDGVLVDSEIIVTKHFVKYLCQYGYQITFEDAIRRFTGKSDKMVYDEINLELEILRFTPDIRDHIQNQIHLALHAKLPAVNGMKQLLETIKINGDCICVASSGTIEKITKSLTVTGLIKYFHHENVFSVENVKNGKPAPDLFLFAAAQMGYHPSACLVIEDSVAGIEAAISAGMNVVGFLGGSHAQYCWYKHSIKAHNISTVKDSDELLKFLLIGKGDTV